jgi:TetR/AcrR family transcriptional repressor of lmrAB and yxaGH operons
MVKFAIELGFSSIIGRIQGDKSYTPIKVARRVFNDSENLTFKIIRQNGLLFIFATMKRDTRQELIEATATCIKTKGYYGTGITEIIETVGVPKGSLYHHFKKGKDELVEAALDFLAQKQSEKFVSVMKGKPNAAEALKAVVDTFKSQDNAQIIEGCPLATLTLEVSGSNEKMRKACSAQYDYWQKGIEDYLVYKNIPGAAQKAESFFVQLEGALLLSRAHQNPKYLEQLKSQIENLINT